MVRNDYDALGRATDRANQMTAASLPYRERAAGALGPQSFLQGAQGGLNVMRGVQDMQIRGQDAVMRAAQHEAEMQNIELRSLALRNEIDLRSQLAPLKLLEASTDLETKQIKQRSDKLDAQARELTIAGMGLMAGNQILTPQGLTDFDEENPWHRAAKGVFDQRQVAVQSEQMEREADISATRARAVRDLREPGSMSENARTGMLRTYKEMFENYRADARNKSLPPGERDTATKRMAYYEGLMSDLQAVSGRDAPRIDSDMVAATAQELGLTEEAASEAISAIAEFLGETPSSLLERLIVYPDEAKKLKKLIQMRAEARGR